MPGHKHDNSHASANTGNTLGDRSCVRQSKLYRMYESGNDVKGILGTSHLEWNTKEKEGVYKGHHVYDHNDPYNEAAGRDRHGGHDSPGSPREVVHTDRGLEKESDIQYNQFSHSYNKRKTQERNNVKERRKNLGAGESIMNLSNSPVRSQPTSNAKINYDTLLSNHRNSPKKTSTGKKTKSGTTAADRMKQRDWGHRSPEREVYGEGGEDGLNEDLDSLDIDSLERLKLGLDELRKMAAEAEENHVVNSPPRRERESPKPHILKKGQHSPGYAQRERERQDRLSLLKEELAELEHGYTPRGVESSYPSESRRNRRDETPTDSEQESDNTADGAYHPNRGLERPYLGKVISHQYLSSEEQKNEKRVGGRRNVGKQGRSDSGNFYANDDDSSSYPAARQNHRDQRGYDSKRRHSPNGSERSRGSRSSRNSQNLISPSKGILKNANPNASYKSPPITNSYANDNNANKRGGVVPPPAGPGGRYVVKYDKNGKELIRTYGHGREEGAKGSQFGFGKYGEKMDGESSAGPSKNRNKGRSAPFATQPELGDVSLTNRDGDSSERPFNPYNAASSISRDKYSSSAGGESEGGIQDNYDSLSKSELFNSHNLSRARGRNAFNQQDKVNQEKRDNKLFGGETIVGASNRNRMKESERVTRPW